MIEVRNLAYSYHKNQPVLKGIDFSLQDGEILAIAGRNGTGKTTVTRLLMGLLQPEQGTICFQGRDAAKVSVAERARMLGYVFQNPDRQLFANTVLEEAEYAPLQLGCDPSSARQQAAAALDGVGLLAMAKKSPQLLSRGQKQRLTIASALAAEPKVLILDEPTSGQDCRERTHLLRLMRSLNQKGMAILLVTHDMDIIAEHADRMLVLADGGIGFCGTPAELFADEAKTCALGLELPESVRISRELDLPLCLTPSEIYGVLERRTGTHA